MTIKNHNKSHYRLVIRSAWPPWKMAMVILHANFKIHQLLSGYKGRTELVKKARIYNSKNHIVIGLRRTSGGEEWGIWKEHYDPKSALVTGPRWLSRADKERDLAQQEKKPEPWPSNDVIKHIVRSDLSILDTAEVLAALGSVNPDFYTIDPDGEPTTTMYQDPHFADNALVRGHLHRPDGHCELTLISMNQTPAESIGVARKEFMAAKRRETGLRIVK